MCNKEDPIGQKSFPLSEMRAASVALRASRLGVCRRGVCTSGGVARTPSASSRSPRLPIWGSFGRSSEEISRLEAAVRASGDKQVALTKGLAELGQRTFAMLLAPMAWVNPDKYAAFTMKSDEVMERSDQRPNHPPNPHPNDPRPSFRL